ncbi:MAG: CBS domain-containing protein [Uliginosibacterium sp.]|jgi:magnesium and cobalt transporter|nr:CBS domain-containing protein [Uliginosibacterium sp.]MBK9393781.1 CBS domain-containing protein [Uliginosibacterium sp.]
MEPDSSRPNLLERLIAFIGREPEGRDALMQQLHSAFERHVFDADALFIIEGALNVADIQVRNVMVPRAHMDVVRADAPFAELIEFAMRTGHSRFPVVGEDKDDVQGILLAKDLLRGLGKAEFRLRENLRPAVFIPESKRLNVLLREFRVSHNHMAMVVDEYGGISGLITIEDVLEQIVGDIEDEFDLDESAGNIVADQLGRYRVKAGTDITSFNEAFGTTIEPGDIDTVGGLVTSRLGYLPKRGDGVVIAGLSFKVLRADGRRILTLLVECLPDGAEKAPQQP